MNQSADPKTYEDIPDIDTSKYAEYAELVRQSSAFSLVSNFPEFFAPKPAPLTLTFGR